MTNWDHMTELVSAIPDLPGARCKGRADLYEKTIAVRHNASRSDRQERDTARAAALRICVGCPALEPCRAWLDQQRPTRRPPALSPAK